RGSMIFVSASSSGIMVPSVLTSSETLPNTWSY
ncbi:MAG: hypothetical protein ACJAXT_001965, partial [Paracoccaceae bacterium]